ncbi:MAG: glycerophosphodiester phosphodiesterase [Bacillota bacterium]|jgi:glycerophosphoryl diester phosphodiesterase|nr:glycerophosphodiester phosphodiesterase [Bacillota bacterium]NLL26385.1 glycerophosphodiester phosphodiesterase [Erysipelotrichia bacterium]
MTYIWAHRGASAYAPENTLEAIKLAIDQKAEGIELDVHYTKDEVVVVIHDETIDRVSDGKGFVKDFNYEELKKFNFNKKNKAYPFCQIPTLEEVLQLLKPTNLILNIELKNAIFNYDGMEKKIIELVKEYEMENRVIYSSFNHYSLVKILELDPKANCGFLHSDKIIDMPKYAKSHKMKYLHPAFYLLLDQNYIKEANENNLLINTWTINDPIYIYAALKTEINAIITNCPDKALLIREDFLNEKASGKNI